MRRAIYPGSFDPVTYGHLDIISRATQLYDELVVGVLINSHKKCLFSVEERMQLLRDTTREYAHVRITSFDGLLVEYCKQQDISVIVKGLRAVSDFDYELQMAQMNWELAGVETMFMATNPLYSFLSSSLVKEVARHGGDVTRYVPHRVTHALQQAYNT